MPFQDVQADIDTPAAPDTVVVPAEPDTVGLFSRLSRDLSDAGDLIAAGDYDAFMAVLGPALVQIGQRIFSALIVLLLFWFGYRVFNSVISRFFKQSKHVTRGVEQLLLKALKVAIFTFGFVMVLAQLGFDITTLIAGLGIAGIALGFAAKDTLENFISGIAILLDQPFRVGDNVEVEDIFGRVEEITLRSTRVRTLNNEMVIMPNNQMVNQKLINHSMLGVLRIKVPFGIAYKESPQQARDAVLPLVEGDPRIHPDYPPKVVVTGLNDSSVDMELRVWIKDPLLEFPVRFEYVEKVFEALRAAGIEIPFPHLQLFIDEAKAFENAPFMQPSNGSPSRSAYD